ISIKDMEDAGKDKDSIEVRVIPPVAKITLQRIRKQFHMTEKQLVKGISLKLDECDHDKYRITHTQQDGLPIASNKSKIKAEDITHVREKREFSQFTLVAEISRYLNKSPLIIEDILENTQEGIEAIVSAVNEFNEVLYDWVIPHLFAELYDITTTEQTEPYEVDLVKIPKDGFYRISADLKDTVMRSSVTIPEQAEKSFHLDTYCFDSKPEQKLFWNLLKDGRVKKLYFTGMLTHGQSDFYIQYIDPDSHTVRSYYPDFLFQKNDDTYVIVEVKGDHEIDNPVVQAKKTFAEAIAGASKMTYRMLESSKANAGIHSMLFEDDLQAS
ncbi:MAG: type III restriction endonuclease, partial [Pseudanabaena sp. M109S1SP2A07QC]|nr:type III restriction endonuclease [Pseudanabaena sp. M109S1SP2A07QC]